MSGWDDLYAKLDRQPDGERVEGWKPALPKDLWPPLLIAMFDDPKRPRALTPGDAYPICEYLIDRWINAEREAAGLPEYDPELPGWRAWDDARLRSLGFTPGKVHDAKRPPVYLPLDFRRDVPGRTYGNFEASYFGAINFAVFNALKAEGSPEDEWDEEPDVIAVIPDHGLTIEEYAEALGVSKRTAEKRLRPLIAEGSVRAVNEPTGTGGMPRKRYYRGDAEDATEGAT